MNTLSLVFVHTLLLLCLEAGQGQAGCSDQLEVEDPSLITLAGVYDTTGYDWAPDVFAVTVKLINEGWWDVFPKGSNLRLAYDLEDSMCDETIAMRGYWKLRAENGNRPMHGLIGARCSGPSMALSRLAGLEGVPQLSPASNAESLSHYKDFPNFTRMVSPNDERGEVGAIVALLRSFGWKRIGILETDTKFAKDLVTAFKKSWVGEHGDWFGQVAFSDTIRLKEGFVDEEGLRQVLGSIPSDPAVTSRVILLAAHAEHAADIIQAATESGLVPEDTIWIGTSSWATRMDLQDSWLPAHPGYLGVAPLSNRDQVYDSFMKELQTYQQQAGKEIIQELPLFAAETVDSIRALATAIAHTNNRRDGEAITKKLRGLTFDGVSGHVAFTAEGDRKDPLFSIFNVQPEGAKTLSWNSIGTVGTELGSAVLENGIESVCFAEVGCGLSSAPEDTYPLPPMAAWAISIIAFLVVVFIALVALTAKYRSKSIKDKNRKRELAAFRDSIVGMRTAEAKHTIPRVNKKGGDLEQGLNSGTMSVIPRSNVQWMWKESPHRMRQHDDRAVFGDPHDCWVLYTPSCTRKIEEAYQKGEKKFRGLDGYVINFRKMKQTKVATGFVRDVQRTDSADSDRSDQTDSTIDLSQVSVAEEAPADIQKLKEPMLVLCGGDVIQISKHHPSGRWAFGTKLHNADEAAAEQLVVLALDGLEQRDEGQISKESGWFELEKTRVSTPEDLEVIKTTVGSGALDPPPYWDDVAGASAVEKIELKPGDRERAEVEAAFLSTLPSRTRVLKVERVQNLAMWQTYVVKRQTVCYRETGETGDQADLQEALQRFERKWLFHGTNYDTMDKILQQGFNRSFCGKHATLYGKGTYFARDSSYSSHKIYATPDHNGSQYIMACRVVVGEYCRGTQDALTPDVRDQKSQLLYDSTVDSAGNPNIFVTYHDAQAYPEYLITFKTG